MKGITITGSDVKREFLIWLATLFVAIGINIYAIIFFDGNWSEIYTQFPIVLVISVVLYLSLVIVRGILFGIKILLRKIINRKG